MKLMPHQEKASNELSNGKILYGGVGSGKSLTAVAYYQKNEAPKDVYIITTAKKRDTLDWERDFVKIGVGTEISTQGILTVDSWNNIKNYTEVEDAFFIFDEQRVVGSGTWVKSFIKIARNNNWILLSATPGDTWLDYIPVFIANNLYKNRTEFYREHVIFASYSRYPMVVGYRRERLLEKYRNMLLVEMPYISHTNRIEKELEVDYDVDLYRVVVKDRWNPFTNKPIKDASELFRLMKRVVYTDSSRLEKIKELIKEHHKLIVYYQHNYELDILRSLSNVVEVAEWNGHKKQQIPETDSWVYLVQYVSGAEGWNCRDTDAMVFYSLTYSYKNFKQAQGRIDRLDTLYTDLYYYILVSKASIDLAVKQAHSNKKGFNERLWGKEMGLI